MRVVVSDQLMPGMRGEELLAAVHEREREMLNVLFTGQATADAVGAAVNRARLYRYIGKPWPEHDLALTVREALRVWSQRRRFCARSRSSSRPRLEPALRPAGVPRPARAQRLVDVRFGDHIVREMHMLFSDMRGYTAMVEGKTPAEAFRFFNAYVQRAEQPIRAHGGFISNIEGDAILALFPGTADGAVRAGIETHRVLLEMNAARAGEGEAAIGMGVGVHSGRLLLGTVGGEERIQCDVVGDPVNLCARIESLTKRYDTAMLISGFTRDRLQGEFALRAVDVVRVKGKTRPVELFEVLDALDDERRARRSAGAPALGDALAAFRAGRIDEAHRGFARVVEADTGDGVARLFVERCARLLREGTPAGFDGITTLDRK